MPLELSNQPSLPDTTFWFSVSKAAATSWMSPPKLRGAVASIGFSDKSRLLKLYCHSGREHSQGRGRDHGAGTLQRVQGHPPRGKVDSIPQGQESPSDFIAKKDLKKLVQPIDFGQLRYLFYFYG